MVRLRTPRLFSIDIQHTTLCPFLYQTRTIVTRRHLSSPSAAIPHQDEDITLSFLQQKARDVETRRKVVDSSITSAEREVFETIRRKFGAKLDSISLPPTLSLPDSISREGHSEIIEHSPTAPPSGPEPISTSPADTNVNAILSLFAPIESHVQFSAFINDDSSASTANEDTQSTRPPDAPQTIRQTAKQSLQFTSDSLNKALISTTNPPDLVVWRVLESEVFPLITLLQTQQSPLNTNPYQRPLSALSNSSNLPPSLLSAPPETPLLPLITIHYPAAILLALRMYIAHLPTSGFALALLPKIRSLGPASYLLAANPHFYNALIHLQWNTYSDIWAINRLLSDMRRSGVEYSRGTLSLVEGMMSQRNDDIEGNNQRGIGRGRDWWEMKRQDEGWKKVVRKWKWDITKQINERESFLAVSD